MFGKNLLVLAVVDESSFGVLTSEKVVALKLVATTALNSYHKEINQIATFVLYPSNQATFN